MRERRKKGENCRGVGAGKWREREGYRGRRREEGGERAIEWSSSVTMAALSSPI